MAAAISMSLLGTLFVLAGCASVPGTILDGPPTDPAHLPFTAFIKATGDDYFWLTAPPRGAHMLASTDIQVPKNGLWLSEGWFYLQVECYSPKKAPYVAYPILPERGDESVIHLRGGHRYLLKCDDYRVERADLTDLGSFPGF